MIFLQAVVAFLISTIVYDVLHYIFHLCIKSNNKLLKLIGHWHNIHHRFFPATLNIHIEWTKQNLIQHVLLEYLTQIIVTLLLLLFLNSVAIFLALFFESFLFLLVCYWRGVDFHHRSYSILPSHRGGFFVSASYHALHHIYPNNYYSGYVKILDYILGSGMQLKGKKIALTGANGALGSNIKILLEKEGAIISTIKFGVDYHYGDYEKLKILLADIDILFLCHGSKYDNAQQANCDSFIQIINTFINVRKRELIPLEIWGVGSEIECHPCFGIKKLKVYAQSKRNYAKQARVYFHDREIQYRHIVHSAFSSRMGPGLMSAKFAASATIFLLKRGFKYIPVTYTGIAFLNYFRFIVAPRK
jgi:monoglucosyldiacylglycerol epimerase